MKPKLSALLTTLLGVVLFAVVLHVVGLENIIAPFSTFNLKLFAIFMGFALLNRFLMVFRWDLIISSLGYRVPILNLFWYFFTGFTFGYVIPSAQMGGEPVKAMLLKRHDVPISDALSSVVIEASVAFTIKLLLGSLVFLLLAISYPLSRGFKILLLVLAVINGTLLITFYWRVFHGLPLFTPLFTKLGFRKRKGLRTIFSKVKEVEERIIEFFTGRPKVLFEVILVSAIGLGVLVLEFYFALMVIGYNPKLIEAFFALGAQSLVYLAPMPASVGVQEAGQATMGHVTGFTSSVGVALSLVIRVRDLIWCIIGSTFLISHGPQTAKMLVKEFLDEIK